jgi:two-component system OmpR family response regulator
VDAFRWISHGDIPDHYDLRRQGWRLAAAEEAGRGCVTIIHAPGIDRSDLARLRAGTGREARRLILISGVNAPEDRAELLGHGFGDVIGDDVSIVELNARARRVSAFGHWVPRSRAIATLDLDLMAREAAYNGKPLNLGPREFAMLWRLAETPDETVAKQTLLDDIWRLGFVPESNSLAVQISRMRGKLAVAGLKGLVETTTSGYRLLSAVLEPKSGVLRHIS